MVRFLFQRYAAHHEPAVRDFIGGLLPADLPILVQAPGVRLRERPLAGGGVLRIAINTTARPATVRLPPGVHRELAWDAARSDLLADDLGALALPAHGVRILCA